MDNQDRLKIERIGGFGGFGLPGSHLKSGADMALSELAVGELQALEALFQGHAHLDAPKTDGFIYRITRKIDGKLQTIEISEEHAPVSIRNSVKDTLD